MKYVIILSIQVLQIIIFSLFLWQTSYAQACYWSPHGYSYVLWGRTFYCYVCHHISFVRLVCNLRILYHLTFLKFEIHNLCFPFLGLMGKRLISSVFGFDLSILYLSTVLSLLLHHLVLHKLAPLIGHPFSQCTLKYLGFWLHATSSFFLLHL